MRRRKIFPIIRLFLREFSNRQILMQLIHFPRPRRKLKQARRSEHFYGSNPNGTWSLFVVDDNGNNAGTISGGWNLSIKTSTTACLPTISPSAQSFSSIGRNWKFPNRHGGRLRLDCFDNKSFYYL